MFSKARTSAVGALVLVSACAGESRYFDPQLRNSLAIGAPLPTYFGRQAIREIREAKTASRSAELLEFSHSGLTFPDFRLRVRSLLVELSEGVVNGFLYWTNDQKERRTFDGWRALRLSPGKTPCKELSAIFGQQPYGRIRCPSALLDSSSCRGAAEVWIWFGPSHGTTVYCDAQGRVTSFEHEVEPLRSSTEAAEPSVKGRGVRHD